MTDTPPLPPGLLLDIQDGPNPWSGLGLPTSAHRFSFVLISDRTGGARPGVFERGLAVTDLLAPSFAIQLGDMIESYTNDQAELDTQWAQIDTMFARMNTDVFHVPGNHDVSSDFQLRTWRRRYGRTYFHFRYQDALFLQLDTQDTPDVIPAEALEGLERFAQAQSTDPIGLRKRVTVTVTDRGPILVNVLLEGVRDIDGQPVLPLATRTVPIM
ncbi:metallophosphoesterase family protein [Frankia gtarii]|uniref:metallophosphoesterase family protein n=1 Tax=Frankia gtarii TaxID=2950102 RepID=UPI0021C17E68|nr:hypothetical protein [Frankia gtarii]